MAEVNPGSSGNGKDLSDEEKVRQIMADTGVDEVEARFMLKHSKTGEGDVELPESGKR